MASADSESEIYVNLEKNGLYQVDWGDGFKEVLEGKPYHHQSDRSEHSFSEDGEYTITITTTDLKEVIALSIPSYLNDTNISAMEIGNLPNLSLLDVGKNTLLDGADFSTKFPKLKYLFFQSDIINNFNLTNNSELERLILSTKNLLSTEGLENLTN